MKTRHHIIYLPGIRDDDFAVIQTRALKFFRLYGFKSDYHYIGWSDKEAFKPKLERILSSIDSCAADGESVTLLGTSAGASAAINAYVERKHLVNKVILICGKIQNKQTISARIFEHNPAFRDAMEILPSSLSKLTAKDLNKLVSVKPLWDNIVPPADTVVPGVRSLLQLTIGHGFSILWGLSFGSFKLARFIKS